MKKILYLTVLSLCFFHLFGMIAFSQSPTAQRRGVDYLDYSLGVEAWIQANQQMDYANSDLNKEAFNVGSREFGWQGDDNLFGPTGELRIVNTGTLMDSLSFSARAMFGTFDVYDSYGFPQYGANYYDLRTKYTDVMVRAKFNFIPKMKYFQIGCYAAYHYKKYKFSITKPAPFPGFDEEELYGGGVGLDTSILFGNSGIFAYGNGEWIPYISYMNNDETGWGFTIEGGLGYALSGGSYMPITVTFLAGYRYHNTKTNDYFDETLDSATGSIVISW